MKLLTTLLFLTLLISQECEDGFTYFEDVPVSTTSIPFGVNCFNDQDLNFLNDLNSYNSLNYISPIEIGTQTWFDGRLTNFVAGYYTSGVNSQISIIPESISDANHLRTCQTKKTIPQLSNQPTQDGSCPGCHLILHPMEGF